MVGEPIITDLVDLLQANDAESYGVPAFIMGSRSLGKLLGR